MNWKRILVWVAGPPTIAFAVLWLGTLVHEGGHALVGVACGSHLTEMNVLGVDFLPHLQFHYEPRYYGYVRFAPPLPFPQAEYMAAAGSLSTLAVALLTQAILWLAPPRRLWPRLILTGFSFSRIDLIYHTRDTMSLRSPFFAVHKSGYAEAYNALVALGVPEVQLGAAIVAVSLLLLLLTLIRWILFLRPQPKERER